MRTERRQPRRVAERLYRIVLLAFPRDVRRRLGDEMVTLFLRQRDLVTKRRRGSVGFWIQAVGDCLRHGLAQRLGRATVTAAPKGMRMPATHHRAPRAVPGSGMVIELRQAMRGLRHRPGVVTLVIMTFALGIGASSAMYSVGRAVLLAPLPFDDSAALVGIWTQRGDGNLASVAPRELLDLRERSQTLVGVAGWQADQVVLSADGDAVRIPRARVTMNVFEVLGARPQLGRTFAAGEGWPDQARVAVLGDGLWRRELGADADVLDMSLTINGERFQVVGVMPRGFQLPTDFGSDRPTQLWTPLDMNLEAVPRAAHFLSAAGRVAAGVGTETTRAELERISAALTAEGEYPEGDAFRLVSVPIEQQILGTATPVLLLLSGAAACLLLIACMNVALLLLTRAEGRRREMAVCAALGAGRARLLRAQVAEALLLAMAGGALGVGIALGASPVLEATGGVMVPRAGDVVVDWGVLAFTVTISAIVAVVCAVPAGWVAMRGATAAGFHAGSRLSRPWRSGLSTPTVVLQLALAFVLLVGAGLMARTLWSYQRIDLGFRPAGALAAQVVLPTASYDSPAKVTTYMRSLVDGVRSLPGVDAVGVVRSIPIGTTGADWGVDVDGYAPEPDEPMQSDWQVVTDGAIEALGVRLIDGRVITPGDMSASEPVGMVNQAMARRFWPGRSAVGGHFRMRAARDAPWVRVVGVVGDVRHDDFVSDVTPKFYLPYSQFFRSSGFSVTDGTLVVRTAGDPVDLAGAVAATARSIDAGVPLSGIRTLREMVAMALARQRLAGIVLALFATVALLLAGLGVYGLIASLVSRRRQEFGVRVAIGATRHDVLALVFRRGVGLAGAGLVAGVACALVAARGLESLLFGVTSLDPLTYMAVSVGLLAVALLACLVPAWRAARLDPLRALRES